MREAQGVRIGNILPIGEADGKNFCSNRTGPDSAEIIDRQRIKERNNKRRNVAKGNYGTLEITINCHSV